MARFGSDKEIAAVTLNFKEQRVLEKTLHTLSLEESYSLKLLDLDHRELRVSHSRLRNRVSKIKSHLSPEQIAEIRQMEADGRFKLSPVAMGTSSAQRIKSAGRALKLWSARRGNTPNQPKRVAPSAPTSPTVSYKTLTNSPMHEDDVSAPKIGRRPQSAWTYPSERSSCANPVTSERSVSATPVIPERSVRANTATPRTSSKSRTVSTHGEETQKFNATPIRPVSVCAPRRKPGVTKPQVRAKTAMGYSSHRSPRPGSDDNADENSQGSNNRKTSQESVDSVFDDYPYEMRRKTLIENEIIHGLELKERRATLFENVKKTLAQSPPVKFQRNASADINEDDITDRPASRATGRRKSRVVSLAEGDLVNENEIVQPQEMSDTLWKDMKKCRYLRMDDDQLDLSGYVTLVKAQLHAGDEKPARRSLTVPEPRPDENVVETTAPS